jgi:O-antigen/teichoic acid export membrane protein
MIENIKSAAKGTIIYGLANVSIKLIGIVLIPIYTNYKYLSKEDFGVLGIMDITYQLVIIVFGFALYQSLARWYYDPQHKASQKSMHFTIVIVNAIICCISLVLVYKFSTGISGLLFNTGKYSHLIWIMFASASVNIISTVSMMLLRLQEKARKYAAISIIKLLITLSVTIFLVVYRGRNVLGVYEATLVGELAGLIMISGDIIKNSVPRFEFRKLVQMLGYSFPLMLAAVSSVLLNTIDRYSLNYLADLDAVGTYTLAFRISNTIKVVVISSIQLSIVPIFFKKLGDQDLKRFISKSMNYSALLVMICILFVSLFSLEIVKVFSANVAYWEAANIIPILAFSMIFIMMKENVIIGLQITKSSVTMGTLIALTALCNLGLNMLLIPRFLLYGAATATIISQSGMFLLFYYVAQRKYFIPYDMKKLLMLLLIGVLLFMLSLISNNWPILPRLIFKSGLILALPLLLIPIGFFEAIELQRIKEFCQKYILNVFRKSNQ